MTANDAKLYLTDLWESDWTSVDETIALEMAIKALTAIEDIKAEIEKLPTYDRFYSYGMVEAVISKDDVMRIIDKHIGGKESE